MVRLPRLGNPCSVFAPSKTVIILQDSAPPCLAFPSICLSYKFITSSVLFLAFHNHLHNWKLHYIEFIFFYKIWYRCWIFIDGVLINLFILLLVLYHFSIYFTWCMLYDNNWFLLILITWCFTHWDKKFSKMVWVGGEVQNVQFWHWVQGIGPSSGNI